MIILSQHTEREMVQRGIVMAYIESTLAAPDHVRPDPVDAALTRSYRVIAEFGNRVLRVVHRPDPMGVFIVTAHWDRGAKW